MPFVQATIPVENTEVFSQLKGLIAAALAPTAIERFLQGVQKSKRPVRHFEEILAAGIFERASGAEVVKGSAWYGELSPSDQGQIREFYLTRIEQVEGAVREKFSKVYRYQ